MSAGNVLAGPTNEGADAWDRVLAATLNGDAWAARNLGRTYGSHLAGAAGGLERFGSQVGVSVRGSFNIRPCSLSRHLRRGTQKRGGVQGCSGPARQPGRHGSCVCRATDDAPFLRTPPCCSLPYFTACCTAGPPPPPPRPHTPTLWSPTRQTLCWVQWTRCGRQVGAWGERRCGVEGGRGRVGVWWMCMHGGCEERHTW